MAEYRQLELFPDLIRTTPNDKQENKKNDEQLSKHKLKLEGFRNLNLIKDLANENGYYPIILKAVTGIIPRELIAFSKASRANLRNKIVHFYEYDYVIDRIWRNPKKYIKMLKRALAVIGPDFSIAPRFPEEVNIWSFYKIRVISHYLINNGVALIPNIPVCSPQYYNLVFDSLEEGGIYAISNVQAYNNYFSRHQWYTFVREVIRRLKPEALIIYGNRMEVAGVKTYYFDNENIISLRRGKKIS